jgi:hypothetical protein
MAHVDALPRIRAHGLLSTTALLDLFEVPAEKRLAMETQMRKKSVVIEHPSLGRAVIRDQIPIGSDKQLTKSLEGTASAADWHRLLNSKVFFWVTRERLDRLRNAGAYRTSPQLILVLDTKRVVEAAEDRIWLSSMNSGAVGRFAHPRSPDTFQKLKNYDFDYWCKKRGGIENAVIECAIDRELQSVEQVVKSSHIVGASSA